MNSAAEDRSRACEEFQQRLSVLVQSGEALYGDPHLENCTYCRGLVVDLETIAEAARDLFGEQD